MQRNPLDSQSFDNARGTYFLGRYRVVDEIGIGGMASVHLARMDGPGGFQKWAAIKRIHPHLIEDDSFVQMFFDEARVAARISHPNVATVFELGKHEDTYWIAMEYLHGEPLRELMRRTEELSRPMPPEIACKIISDAAEGLHAAHELSGNNGEKLGLVHRDVTPHNLFVTYDGVTKVVDFGIAKFSSRMSSSTRAGTLKGKLAYMAPEQIQGETIDRRSDIFALGVVLWELTTGQRLFRMDNDLDTLAKVQECNVPRPSTLIRGYPVDLEKIIMKALVKNRGERYRTAREFSRALQSFFLRRGLFIASDEIAAYMNSIFHDRMQKREAHLRWAAEVTQTVSVGSLSGSHAPPPDEAPAGPRPAAGAPAKRESADAANLLPPVRTTAAPTAAPGLARPPHIPPHAPIGVAAPTPSKPPSGPPRARASSAPSGLPPERARIPTQFGIAPPPGAPVGKTADRPSMAPSPPRAASQRPSGPAQSEPPTMIAQARKATLPPPIPSLHIGAMSHLDGALPPPEDDGEENDETVVEPTPFEHAPEPSAETRARDPGPGHPPAAHQGFPPPAGAAAGREPSSEGEFNPFAGDTYMPHLGVMAGAAPIVTSPHGPGGFSLGGQGYVNPLANTVPPMGAQAATELRTVTVQSVQQRRRRTIALFVALGTGIALLATVAIFVFTRPKVEAPTPETASKGSATPTGVPGAMGTGPFGNARRAFSSVIQVASPPPTPAPTAQAPGSPEPPLPAPTAAPADTAPPVAPQPDPAPTASAKAPAKAPDPPPPHAVDPPKKNPTPVTPPPSPQAATGTGQLKIVCLPSCADISDNGASLGPGPIFGRSAPAGRHTIKLTSTSSPPVVKVISVSVKPDQTTEVRQSMVQ